MRDIDKIMNMLDWNNTPNVQKKGIEYGKKINNINVFVFPNDPGKSVWENCAKILADKPDEILNPYLSRLLEWIEDINWPGALIILDRLKEFSETNMLSFWVKECVKIAVAMNNRIWLRSISELLDNKKMKTELPKDILEVLQSFYHD